MTKTEIRQKWLFNELRKYPMNGYRGFLTMYIATFGKSERTFVRDWKEAQKKLKAWNSKVMDTLIAKEVAKGVEEEKTYLLTRLEVLQYLSDIARGEPYDTDEGKVYPTFRDQLRAIEQLAKMEGWYAPEKQEVNTNFVVTGLKII